MKPIRQLPILSRIEEHLRRLRLLKWQFQLATSCLKELLDRKRAIYNSLSNQIKNERKRLTTLQTSYPLQFPERLYRPFTERLIGLEGRLLRSGQDITGYRKSQYSTIKWYAVLLLA